MLSLKNLFNNQFNESKDNINNAPVIKTQIENEIKPPRPPPPAETTIKRRNTISTIVKNPEINNSTNDIRQNGSLQDHLKHALSTKYKALRPDSPDDNFD